METIEYWRWWIVSETTGKRTRSRWHMTAETAAGYPGAERVPGTLELRPAGGLPAHSTPKTPGADTEGWRHLIKRPG